MLLSVALIVACDVCFVLLCVVFRLCVVRCVLFVVLRGSMRFAYVCARVRAHARTCACPSAHVQVRTHAC